MKGISYRTIAKFADEGAYVLVTGRRQSELDKAANQIGKNNVIGIQSDVSNLSDLDRLYDTVTQQKAIFYIQDPMTSYSYTKYHLFLFLS